jgi:hypothetical protein
MGQLLDDLRGINRTRETPAYNPIWLNIVHRNGKFIMGFESLQEEMRVCKILSKQTFDEWLKENNLSIKETSKGNFVISNF